MYFMFYMNYAVVIIHSFDQWIESYVGSCFLLLMIFYVHLALALIKL